MANQYMSDREMIVIGARHGKLLIVADQGIHRTRRLYRVRCDCGHEETMSAVMFRRHAECSQCRWPRCKVCGARARSRKSCYCSLAHQRHREYLVRDERYAADPAHQDSVRDYAKNYRARMSAEEYRIWLDKRAAEKRKRRAEDPDFRQRDIERCRAWRAQQNPQALAEKERQRHLSAAQKKILRDLAAIASAKEPS